MEKQFYHFLTVINLPRQEQSKPIKEIIHFQKIT